MSKRRRRALTLAEYLRKRFEAGAGRGLRLTLVPVSPYTTVQFSSPPAGANHMKCPNCSSENALRKSRSGDRDLSPLGRLFIVVVRCDRCGHLFRVPRFLASGLTYKPRT